VRPSKRTTAVGALVALLATLWLVAPATAQMSNCDANPGAPAGAPTITGPITYSTAQTVSNVVIDGDHSDDLVRVNNARVVFDHVTFLGVGAGSAAHALEVTDGGSVTVRDSLFIGAPSGDHIHFGNHLASTIACNVFGQPGGAYEEPGMSDAIGDHVVVGVGGRVDIKSNKFYGESWCTLGDTGGARIDFAYNHCRSLLYLRGNVWNGNIVGNDFISRNSRLWLDEVNNMLIEGNDLDVPVRYGARSSPNGNYFLGNSWAGGTFDYRNGGCRRDGNANPPASLRTNCTAGPPTWYPR
jgi:hypothetical protein